MREHMHISMYVSLSVYGSVCICVLTYIINTRVRRGRNIRRQHSAFSEHVSSVLVQHAQDDMHCADQECGFDRDSEENADFYAAA